MIESNGDWCGRDIRVLEDMCEDVLFQDHRSWSSCKFVSCVHLKKIKK